MGGVVFHWLWPRQSRWWHPAHGVRIGEASNPGPGSVACVSANLGSWRTMRTWVEGRSEDILLLQETRQVSSQLTAAKASASRAGWNSVWAPASVNAHGPASGGLAVLVRAPRRIQLITHEGVHADRWLHAVLELGPQRPLHVVTLYGYDVGQPHAARRNAELFTEIFDVMAELGDARWIIGGDWNTEPQEIWELAADEGKRFFRPPGDPPIGGTCRCSGRTIDFFLASQRMQGEVSAEACFDAPLYPHHPVRIHIASRGRPAPVPVLDQPAAYLMPGDIPIGPCPPASMAWAPQDEAWAAAVRDDDIDGMWACWCAAGEQWLLGWTGLDAPRYRGRGAPRRVVRRQRRSREPTRTDGGLSAKTTHWLTVWRWLRDLRRQVASSSPAAAVQADKVRNLLGHALAFSPSTEGVDTTEWHERSRRLLDVAPQTLECWATEAEQVFRACQREAAGSRRKAWQDWVHRCVRRRPGLLFRWLRGDAIPPVQGVVGHDGWTLAPGAVAEVARRAWTKIWCPGSGPAPWQHRRPDVCDLPLLRGVDLHDIARRLRSGSAGGADGWRAAEIRALPLAFWDRMAQLLHACERLGRWPTALRIGIVSLLPKGTATSPEDMRPVVLLPVVYRIWAAARQSQVREWVHGPGDDAAEIPGQSAPDAAWELAFEVEVTELMGQEVDDTVCGVFLDCSKCYERVPLAELDIRARALQFPDPLLVLALSMYSAPRHVRVGDAVSDPVVASCGIMAGCGLAVALLRAHLRDTVSSQQRDVCGHLIHWSLRRYIDDIVLWAHGKAAQAVSAARAGFTSLTRKLGQCGMQLNRSKSGVVVSTSAGRSAAVADFADSGVSVVCGVRDLGIDTCWGRRCQQTRHQRKKRASIQAERLQRLPSGASFRAQAAAALVVSAAAYGTQVDGLSPTAAAGLRRAVHKALNRGPVGRRAIEADLAFFGDSKRLDPAEASVLAAILAWARMVAADPGRSHAVEAAWNKAVARPGAQIHGPISATLAAINRLGWSNSGPSSWRDSTGREVSLLDLHELRDKVHVDFRRGAWAAAARRRGDFEGAEGGVDEEATRQMLRKWVKRGLHQNVGALRCVLAGGTWTQDRKHRAGFAETPLCPHCCNAPETALHRWWECPAWEALREERGISELARRATSEGYKPVCFWQNGILPSSATAVAPSRFMTVLEGPPECPVPGIAESASPIKMWTDGAASDPTIPQLRRAGWGLWVPDFPDACAAETLVGPCQTAQRSEVRALVAALERSDGNAHIWTDSRFVTRGASSLGSGVIPRMRHSDLWHRAAKAWRHGTTEVHWVKAHLDWPAAEARGISVEVWQGNRRADELAGQGAAAHAPARADADRVRKAHGETRQVQQWMAEVLHLAAEADPRERQIRRPRRGSSGKVLVNRPRELGAPGEHTVAPSSGTHWQCSQCHRRVKKSRGWRVWRRFPCTPAQPLVGPLDRWLVRGA